MKQSEILQRMNHPDMKKVGDRCVEQAREAQERRKQSANNECGQAAKEAAHFLAGRATGRASVIVSGFKGSR